MRNKATQTNIDNSNVASYPDARIKDNTGAGDGTPVNEQVYGDIHEFFAKAMRLYGISYNGLPDNEVNGYQSIDAIRALATKNDFILNITSVGGVINVPVKIGSMLDNEQIMCISTIDKGAEITVKGLDGVTISATFIGNFKNTEYVRMIKTPAGIIFVRQVDFVNIDAAVAEVMYLKAASYAQEEDGLLDTVATTPQTNALVFVERVNGAASDMALAIANVRNGLLSKEDQAKIDNLGDPAERNYGTIGPWDVDSLPVNSTISSSGDITLAKVVQRTDDGDVIECTMGNVMDSTNYEVSINIESGNNFESDNDIKPIPFKRTANNKFRIYVEEDAGSFQQLILHISVKQR